MVIVNRAKTNLIISRLARCEIEMPFDGQSGEQDKLPALPLAVDVVS